jgi:uncharacterized protein
MQLKAESLIDTIDLEGAKKYALDRLTQQLPPTYCYHSVWHTQQEVAKQALVLASAQNLTALEMVLVHTAALYHDIGFTVSRDEHELKGAEIVESILPEFGYTLEEMKIIQRLISATHLSQKPTDILEAILVDADMDQLGRSDFLLRNRLLRQELAFEGQVYSDERWYSDQLIFMQKHRYYTVTAKKLRSEVKYNNIKILNRICHTFPGFDAMFPVNSWQHQFLQHTTL